MSQPDSDRSESNRRILSALADGDATDSEATRAFQAWRDDADARASWHAYQLIGDVLRSDDLAAEPAADEAFLVALRARLADEPVVLAPQPRVEAEPAAMPAAVNAVTAATRSRGRWQGPVAMAAGFLVVIGGLNIVRPFGHGGGANVAAVGASGPILASATSIDNTGVAASSPGKDAVAVAAAQSKAAADQLAPYLAAHRQSGMSGPFQMPGSDIRNASLVQPAR
ncbi:sigma-E factor negative regulatory protein [Scleromatobacter humisilvae]|uniref:Sigma-E factor negative regulatory protein n=1 Tax=Scleromatobacter humisilvae TaxID=2897159 RepID=A0A9X1YKM4_9BURK|nr:sigma-E factor negative regulatory protein [Scleromatobacter humisilvae]MCK9688314.1 sigma-E factor negative regulatory protein [Scleromatobacter humisilvae]